MTLDHPDKSETARKEMLEIARKVVKTSQGARQMLCDL